MNHLRNLAVALIPFTFLGFGIYWGFGTEKYFYELIKTALVDESRIHDIFRLTLYELLTLFYIIVPVIYFITQDAKMKNKLYSIIRHIFIISFLFAIPSIISYLTRINEFNTMIEWSAPIRYAIYVFIAVVLWKEKPSDDSSRINLSEHDLVTYTTKNHRLLHHIVDLLFFYSITYRWSDLFKAIHPGQDTFIIEYLFITFNLLLFYFLSEALFSQTLGKILTGSCVVATKGKLSTVRILCRSLCRIIPFDRFSFLFGANWHDSLSGTTVVYKFSWEDMLFEDEKEASTA